MDIALRKLSMSIPEARALEDAYAAQAQMRADVDFIALMADVELIVDEEVSTTAEVEA